MRSARSPSTGLVEAAQKAKDVRLVVKAGPHVAVAFCCRRAQGGREARLSASIGIEAVFQVTTRPVRLTEGHERAGAGASTKRGGSVEHENRRPYHFEKQEKGPDPQEVR